MEAVKFRWTCWSRWQPARIPTVRFSGGCGRFWRSSPRRKNPCFSGSCGEDPGCRGQSRISGGGISLSRWVIWFFLLRNRNILLYVNIFCETISLKKNLSRSSRLKIILLQKKFKLWSLKNDLWFCMKVLYLWNTN